MKRIHESIMWRMTVISLVLSGGNIAQRVAKASTRTGKCILLMFLDCHLHQLKLKK